MFKDMLVIFDLDGTMLNTIADLAEAANYALEKCGYPKHSPVAYPYYVGNGVRKLLERVLPEDERTAENVELMFGHFIEYYGKNLTRYTEPYPGISQLLRDLRDNDIDIAVASNKYQAAVEELIGHFFSDVEWASISGQREGVPVKPDPSIVFGVLSECPTPKAKVLYVGDSGVDMVTARRAGVTSVGVTWGFRGEKELRENYADHIVESTDEILRLALEIKSRQY